MKITKAQLKQLIKEELQVVLTNEEAGELFGLEVQKELEEAEDLNLSKTDDKVKAVLDREGEMQAIDQDIDRDASLAALKAVLKSADLGELQHNQEAADAVVATYKELLKDKRMSDQEFKGILAAYGIT